jgi:hypothetical protein
VCHLSLVLAWHSGLGRLTKYAAQQHNDHSANLRLML